MVEATTSPKKSLTRGKAILIGILAIVFVAVLYIQFGRQGKEPGDDTVKYHPPRPAVAVQPANATEKPVTLALSKAPPEGSANKEKDVAAAALIDETKWKPPALATVVAYDPFALPATFPQPKTTANAKAPGADGLIAAAEADDAKKLAEAMEKVRRELEELRQRGVHVIVGEGDQYVAWIGERKLHVGDEINGFTVTAIDTDGVHIVEKKESP